MNIILDITYQGHMCLLPRYRYVSTSVFLSLPPQVPAFNMSNENSNIKITIN